jgi:acyl carrier protein
MAPGSTLPRHTLFDRLLTILRRTVEIAEPLETITEATGLLGQGIGIDSIEVLTVVSAIEEEFEITFEDSDLKVAHFATVGALVTFVERRVR